MLFKDTDEVKNHISVNHNFELEDITPSVKQAANKYIIPAIGRDFYNELVTANEGTPDEKQKKAIEHTQAALANYAYFLYVPVGFVQIGNAGIQEANTESASAARQWVTYDLKKALLEAGDIALDVLLEFLEKNADEYPAWKNSDAYTVNKELFINDADTFSKFTNIQNSRRTFLALRPFIAKAERFYITSAISKELFDELKEAMKNGSTDEKQKKVIDLIQPALAQLALHKAIPEIIFQVGADGIRVQSWSNGFLKKDTASDNQLNFLYSTLEVDGNADLKTLQDFLFENADDYPAFKESKIYQNSKTEDLGNCRNSRVYIA